MTRFSSSAPSFEQSDANPTLLAALAGGIGGIVFAVPLILLLVYPQSADRHISRRPDIDSAAPRLQVTPAKDLGAFRNAESAELSTYGWADRDRKTVRIPIEKAQSILIDRGLPGWPR